MKRAIALAVAVLLTAATVRLVLSAVSMDMMAASLRVARWPLVIAALALFAFVQWVRAWRFSLLTTGSLALPDRHFVSVSFRLNLLNFVIPFRAGEFGYPIMMHRETGQGFAEAAGVLVLARIFDLAVVGALILGFASWFGVLAGAWRQWGMAAAVIGLFSPMLVILSARRGLHMHLQEGRIAQLAAELARAADRAGRVGMQLRTLSLTLVTWLCFGAAAAVAARSVTAAITVPASMFAAAAGNLAFALPVNGIAGLGTAQAAWVLVATWAGTAMEPAVLTALMTYATTLAAAILGGGVAFAGSALRWKQ